MRKKIFLDLMAVLTHPWECVFDEHSRVLILGSFPSPKSRQNGFYYGHPQNIFWKTLSFILEKQQPANDKESKIAFLLENRIALWDVLHSCAIEGALDSNIKNPVANKFRPLLNASSISTIFTTGKKATQLFQMLCSKEAGMNSVYLPSTSPANAKVHKSANFLKHWESIAIALKN
ncbi:MAG: DNA-deoxyinosine glycosylase [Campylobacteraceae bacterium]|jgi:hypoxanthine-DNA glycosylase|nr:DNA-deoxyinosine glycosylase [Campylobacteraceae bacterium]